MFKKKLSVIIIIIILTLINIPFIYSATDEGYGEANDNLGQFTDSFENTDNVTVMVDVINNQTLDCMELNYTTAIMNYEDFDTYTEVDGGNDITVNDIRITWSSMRRDAVDYVYKDFGVDYFADFEIQYKVVLTDVEAGDATTTLFMTLPIVSNTFGSYGVGATPNAIIVALCQNAGNDDQFKIYLRQIDGGALLTNKFGASRGIGTYYFTLDRVGIVIRVRLYSDEERTNLLETIQDNFAESTKYRYINAVTSIGSGTDITDHSSGYVEDFWLGDYAGGYEDDGYFITEDYLNYTTGNSLTLLTNTSIPEGTTMTVQFSNDNETWVDNKGNVGSTDIEEGFYAIDLRDLNYTDSYKMVNFTGTPSLTPRLYQLREITTNGTAGEGVSTPSEDYAGLLIVGLIIGLIVGIGASRS